MIISVQQSFVQIFAFIVIIDLRNKKLSVEPRFPMNIEV